MFGDLNLALAVKKRASREESLFGAALSNYPTVSLDIRVCIKRQEVDFARQTKHTDSSVACQMSWSARLRSL